MRGVESRILTTAMFIKPYHSKDMNVVKEDVSECDHLFMVSDLVLKLKIIQNYNETGFMSVNCCYSQPL